MDFEFDPAKSLANKEKHGIDFEDAQELWADGDLLVAPTRSDSEPRFIAVGMIEGRLWTAVFTPRNGLTRLISVRRSRGEEVERYERQRKDH
jgi:uncharacterized DUF497 family protein